MILSWFLPIAANCSFFIKIRNVIHTYTKIFTLKLKFLTRRNLGQASNKLSFISTYRKIILKKLLHVTKNHQICTISSIFVIGKFCCKIRQVSRWIRPFKKYGEILRKNRQVLSNFYLCKIMVKVTWNISMNSIGSRSKSRRNGEMC